MGKVLLAIDGMCPNRQVFDYAVSLCRRIRAELNILHIIDPEIAKGRLSRLKKQLHFARHYMENTMVAATFAETGEHDTARALMDEAAANIRRLLTEKNEQNVQYRVKVRTGDVHGEIEAYVNQHRDVVLAIYDDTVCDDTVPATESDADAASDRAVPAMGRRARHQHSAVVSELKRRLPVPLVARRAEAGTKQSQ
ncbi:MAG: universal stress protein [Thermodesulfobacteriota bacterium]|nr:universal stress protein [Thermodesulfobacteriota bacterium]